MLDDPLATGKAMQIKHIYLLTRMYSFEQRNLKSYIFISSGMLQTKYQGSRPCGFRQEDCFMFPYISLCKTCDPRTGPFWSQRHNLNNLVDVH